MTDSMAQDTVRKKISDILLGRAITDEKMIKQFNIKPLTQQQAINAILDLYIEEAMGLTETNRYDLLSKQQQKQLIEYHKSCLETLEEALNHRKENHA